MASNYYKIWQNVLLKTIKIDIIIASAYGVHLMSTHLLGCYNMGIKYNNK